MDSAKASKPKPDPKQQAAQRQQRLKAIQAVLRFTVPVALGSALVGAIFWVTAGSTLALAGGGGLFAIALSYRYPRAALWFFLFYMPFAGTVTYWIAGGNALFQLAKDAFYVPALLALVLAPKDADSFKIQPRSIVPGLWMMAVLCGLSLLLVSLPNQFSGAARGQPLFQGLLGFKVFMGYVPLIFCTQSLLRRKGDFLFLMRSHTVLAIICCFLCLMQLLMLQTGRCAGTDHLSGDALFVTNLDAKCLVGGALLYSPSQGVIRLPSTFVAPWQWGWFIIGNAYITFATAFSDPVLWGRVLGFVGMGFVTMAAIISGQRVALALVPVSFGILLVLTGQVTNLKRFLPIGTASVVAGAIAWAIFPALIQERIDSFFGRWKASPADDMISAQVEFVWKAVKDLPLGKGLGSATNSCRIFGPVWLIETWFPKVLFEVGIVGLIVFLGFVTLLSVTTFKVYRSLQDPSLRSYAACLWVFVLFISYQTYYYPLDVDPVAVYYWLFIGAIFRLPTLEHQSLVEAVGTIAATPPRTAPPLRVRGDPVTPDPSPPDRVSAPPVAPAPASPGRFVRIREPDRRESDRREPDGSP
ncbi:hormogonium polysaccharide biosynthesis protein HpsL [Prochlorothrix hollandica]|uniref:hormogonium polysaccharide biosynthesis protein HpsL n=1 Tax=Prochlorothrix hollandica TaxID=1223 RepID=UPI00034B939D|nr:hormogonium polysaccharide biosynthesis protein HpsL [Prochlorothrix hollandica]